jgi:Glutathione S-transferase, C-terminal domain
MGCVKGVITQNKPVRHYSVSVFPSLQPLPDSHRVQGPPDFCSHHPQKVCTFLATEHITLADATLAAELQSAFSTADAALRAKLPNVLRLFETIMNQLNLSSFGFPALAEKKALQYTPPPREKKENLKAPAAPPQPKAENREEPQDRSRR